MNTQNDNHTPTSIDEPFDRLVEIGLMELVGGTTPPDLSARILALNTEPHLTMPQIVAVVNYGRRFRWIGVAVAASLLVGMATFLLSTSRLNDAQRIANNDQLSEQQKNISQMVDEFKHLRSAKRFEEMELVARRLNELAPNDPAVRQAWQSAKFIRREMMDAQVADNKESSIWQQLSAVESSAINPAESEAIIDDTIDKDPVVVLMKEKIDMMQRDESSTGGDARGASARTSGQNGHQIDSLNKKLAEYRANKKKRLLHDVAVKPNVLTQNGGRPFVETGSVETSGPQPGLRDRTFAIAPREQLAPATDGTLDLYTQSQGTQNATEKWTGLYAYTDPRLHQRGGPPAVSLRPVFPAIRSNDDGLAEVALQEASPEMTRDLRTEWLLKARRDEKASESGLGDQYAPTVENPFIKAVGGDAVSTFGIDVDTASYSNVRQFLLDMHQLPPVNAVRIEELVNYFHYDYAGPRPDDKAPFATHVEVAGCPWNRDHRLARIAVKGREMDRDKRPQSNLVFLIDVSGSMNEPAKLPLVTYGLEQLTRELGENDHIAIVVYAGNTGLVLPSTSGAKQDVILAALRKLEAGGSTAGGAGIQLAYQIAEENFIKGGTNRIILCTDGDFNVGTTNTDELQKLVATKAKDTGVFISTLGFGRGNLNDAMMVAISDHGNGNYHYIDNRTEARRVLVEEMTGTLVTIAKDVKIQVEFNPAKVAAYRLIGYEKRMLKTEDFNNDKKDAGEIGAGHTVTALYEIVPAGKAVEATPASDDLKYQKPATPPEPVAAVAPAADGASSELLTLKMRYKAPDSDISQKLEWPITDGEKSFDDASQDFRFAAAVAGFGMLLRDSQYKGDYAFSDAMKTAENALGRDEHGFRSEFLEMVKEAQRLKKK